MRGREPASMNEEYDGHAGKTAAYAILTQDVFGTTFEKTARVEPSYQMLRPLLVEFPGIDTKHMTVFAHAAFICLSGAHFTAAVAYDKRTDTLDTLFVLPRRDASAELLAEWACAPAAQFADPETPGYIKTPDMPVYSGLGGEFDTELRDEVARMAKRELGEDVGYDTKKAALDAAFAQLDRQHLCDTKRQIDVTREGTLTLAFEGLHEIALAAAQRVLKESPGAAAPPPEPAAAAAPPPVARQPSEAAQRAFAAAARRAAASTQGPLSFLRV